jgi:heat shock protein HtpX
MTDAAPNLFAQQEANRRRSRRLVIVFVLFFAWLGFGGDVIAFLMTRETEEGYRHAFPMFGVVLTSVGAIMALVAWRTGPERVIWSTKAREITTPKDGAEQQLVNVVEEMAIASGLPRPRIWIVPDLDPNAFATGHDERSAHVAVTEGLLLSLSRDELQAVVAHEMGHIRNLDVRLMTLLAALVGAVLLVSDGMGRMMRYGRFPRSGSGGSRSRSKDGNPLLVILLVLWIVSWVFAPLLIRLLAMGVSRDREYLADAMSAQYTRNPLALASALEKLEQGAPEATASIHKGSAHLCIADPLGRRANVREGRLAAWLGTHPPMTMRIARLKAMGYQELKRSARADVPAIGG